MLGIIEYAKKHYISYFQDYPAIKKEALKCHYQRNLNKSIPESYINLTGGIILIVFLKQFLLILEKRSIINALDFESSLYLILLSLRLSAMIFGIFMKKYAENPAYKYDYRIQNYIGRLLYFIPFIHFGTAMVLALHIIYNDNNNVTQSMGWLLTCFDILINSIWCIGPLKIKILHVVICNTIYCLCCSTRHAEFQKLLPTRMILQPIFAILLLIANDRSIKSNFILKRLLKEQKSVYEKFLLRIQVPVIIVDQKHIIFSNESAKHQLGYTLESFHQKTNKLVSDNGKTLNEEIKERLSNSELGLEPSKEEKYFTRDSIDTDKTFIVSIVESDFFSREKTISLLIRDFTLELAQEDKRLEDRFKNMMLYSLSHELRTPLNILQDALRLARNMKFTKEGKERYDCGKGAWNYLRNKINDTLTYAQLLTGEFVLHETKFSLSRFVKYLEKITTFILQKRKENIRLSFNVSPSLKDEFTGDRERLEQVLFNLLQNAVKYTNKGSIEFSIYHDIENQKIIFEVKDTGCGMNENTINSITRFNTNNEDRRKSTTLIRTDSLDNKACGLGLMVSSMICQKMGGRIDISSIVGKGSCVKVIIPYKIESSESQGDFTKLVEQSFSLVTPRIPDENVIVNPCCRSSNSLQINNYPLSLRINKKVSILIVDDNDFNRVIAKKMVSKYGTFIDEAENGVVAIEKVSRMQKTYPDSTLLVFMDLDMPIMNGIEATRKIRQNPNQPKPYITALTAFASEGERNSCIEAGMDWFLSKPLTKSNLEDLMENVKNITNKS